MPFLKQLSFREQRKCNINVNNNIILLISVIIYLREQMEEIIKDLKYTCDTCGQGFTTSGSLSKHKRKQHSGQIFPCELCSYKSRDKGDLSRHLRSVHGDNFGFTCHHCQHTCLSRTELVDHKREKHNQAESADCPECGASFSSKSHLSLHMTSTHKIILPEVKTRCKRGTKNTRRQYMCEHCDCSYTERKGLTAHLKRYHKEGESETLDFVCTVCGSKFLTRIHMINHCKSMHKDIDIDTVIGSKEENKSKKQKERKIKKELLEKCNICKRNFFSQHELLEHYQDTHDNLLFQDGNNSESEYDDSFNSEEEAEMYEPEIDMNVYDDENESKDTYALKMAKSEFEIPKIETTNSISNLKRKSTFEEDFPASKKNSKEEIVERLFQAMLAASISWKQLNNETFRGFFEKQIGIKIHENAKEEYMDKCYESCLENIRENLGGVPIWIAFVETTGNNL